MVTKEFRCRLLGSRGCDMDHEAISRGGGVYYAPRVINRVVV